MKEVMKKDSFQRMKYKWKNIQNTSPAGKHKLKQGRESSSSGKNVKTGKCFG